MRKLHVVGVSEDGGTLVLADTPGAPGAYIAPVDDRLRAALRRPVRRTNGAGRGSLTPREIQARLRAGAELADVAAEAGLPPERLEAYAAPVLSERARVLEDARAARMSRPQLGPSALPLAAAVGQRLRALLGGPPEAVRWSASRAEDASWTVQFSYAADGANGSAAWRWDRSAHSLTPLNRAAAELGHVPRQGERPAAAQPPVTARPEAAGAGAGHPAAAAVAAAAVPPAAGPPITAGPLAAPPQAPPVGARVSEQAPPVGPRVSEQAPPVAPRVSEQAGFPATEAVRPPAAAAAAAVLHRADGTSGPSRAQDLQVDPAQAPTVAVLAPAPTGGGGAAGPAPAGPAPTAPAPAAPAQPAPESPAVAARTAAADEARDPAPSAVPAAAAAAVPAAGDPAPEPAAPERPDRQPAAREQAPREPAAREPAKPRPRSARRATVPMWADVLLGTTPSEHRDAQTPDPGAATG